MSYKFWNKGQRGLIAVGQLLLLQLDDAARYDIYYIFV